jgi:hypothetical protein
MTRIPLADNPPRDLNEIEEKMIALVKRVRVEGAYCCRVVSVIDLIDRPMTVRVRMSCRRHDDYSFDVEYLSRQRVDCRKVKSLSGHVP